MEGIWHTQSCCPCSMEIHKSSGFAAVPYNNLYRHLVHLCLTSKQKKRPNSDRHLGKVLRLFKLLAYSQYDFHIGGWYSSASKIEKKKGGKKSVIWPLGQTVSMHFSAERPLLVSKIHISFPREMIAYLQYSLLCERRIQISTTCSSNVLFPNYSNMKEINFLPICNTHQYF